MSQLLGTEIFVNGRRSLATRTHGEDYGGGSGHGVTAGEDAFSGGAAFGVSLKSAATCGLEAFGRIHDQRVRSGTQGHDHSLGRNLEL